MEITSFLKYKFILMIILLDIVKNESVNDLLFTNEKFFLSYFINN